MLGTVAFESLPSAFYLRIRTNVKVIHQWRDWLLEYVGVGLYFLIKRDNKTIVRTIAAKNDMNAENQYQIIIKAAKKMSKTESLGEY